VLKWLGRYHSDLVSRGASSRPHLRLVEVQGVAIPYFLALFALVVVSVILRPVDNVRHLLVVVTGVPTLIAMVYAIATYTIACVAADWKRSKDA
jgi:hypothetical protein